jgi:glycosyltransferase involved in cell wall biosynthesis
MKLSVVIITLNEEKNIRRCLESVKIIADEIVVVDSLSTDKTEEICGEYNVRFIKEKFRGYVEQVNYAMELATNNFVLAIDADEELSDELIEAVQAVKQNKTADAYEINRLSSYCGKFIYHGTWHPDIKVRLWDKTKGKWGGENPHYVIQLVEGSKVERLKGKLNHYTYYTMAEHILQMNKFSAIAADEAFRKNKKASVFFHIVLGPFYTFVKSYFIKLGFLDGLAGFQVAISGAFYSFLKYSKLREKIKSNSV